MAVTFSLPTVLAKLADGQSTMQASGTTLGDVFGAPLMVEETGGYYHVRPR